MAFFKNISGRKLWETIYGWLPFTVISGVNTFFKGDVTIYGTLFNQSNTVTLKGASLKSSNEILLLETEDNLKQYTFGVSSKTNGINTPTRYPNAYEYWDKNSQTGQFQPSISTTIDFALNTNFDKSNPTSPVTGYEYTYSVIVQAQGTLQVSNWYLRSATGFKNYYIKMYKGIVTPGQEASSSILWQTHTDKDILEGNCFNAAADVNNDILLPLGNTYYQTDQQFYTFIGYAQNQIQFEAGLLPIGGGGSIVYPYVLADGYYVYNTPVHIPVKVVGDWLNIEGSKIMVEDSVFGVTVDFEQGDYNYTDVYLWSNGMNNPNKTCQLRVAMYNYDTNELITQGNILIDQTFNNKSFLRIPHTTIGNIKTTKKVRLCFVSNDHTTSGVIRLAKVSSNNTNDTGFMFSAELVGGGNFPNLFTDLTNLSTNSDNIISKTSFNTTYVNSQLVGNVAPFAKGLTI